jgi:hypothetical protein
MPSHTNALKNSNFLTQAHALGATHWDDADIYGDTEDLVGKWFLANPSKRADIFVTTKFGFAGVDEKSGEFMVRSDREWVRSRCESSLAKMKCGHIDLYVRVPQDYGEEGRKLMRSSIVTVLMVRQVSKRRLRLWLNSKSKRFYHRQHNSATNDLLTRSLLAPVQRR